MYNSNGEHEQYIQMKKEIDDIIGALSVVLAPQIKAKMGSGSSEEQLKSRSREVAAHYSSRGYMESWATVAVATMEVLNRLASQVKEMVNEDDTVSVVGGKTFAFQLELAETMLRDFISPIVHGFADNEGMSMAEFSGRVRNLVDTYSDGDLFRGLLDIGLACIDMFHHYAQKIDSKFS